MATNPWPSVHDTSGLTFHEKGLYRNAQLLGMPAGIEAYKTHLFNNKQLATGSMAHQGFIGARLEGIGRGGVAAARQAVVDPFATGALEALGGGLFHGQEASAHWMGFGFKKTGTVAELIKTGQNPFQSTGHIFTKGGAQKAGMKASSSVGGRMWAAKGAMFGAVLGAGFVGHAAIKGFENEGVMGAAKGAVGEIALFGAFHVAIRLLGPAMVPIVASGMAWSHAAKNVMADLRHAPNRNGGYNIAGDMSAFQGGKAYTMRQRSMQAIQKHHLNARSALGNEATNMHVGSLRMM